jgi:CubicO group peptidase (beta-lactamase class C family)/predicted aspartyl protease
MAPSQPPAIFTAMRKMFVLILLLATTVNAQQLSDVASAVQKLADANQFSGSLLVAKDGKPVLSKAWGLADVTVKAPNTIDTKFNIGSINKFFTKTAIAQLAESGKLSLDDTVRKHLPDYPSPVADRITIRQLVDHRSGLGDIFGDRYDAAPPSRLLELKDFLPLFADEPLQFEPGTSQHYSNAGYIVLGLIIERITGEKYRDYVQKHIFAPAGMRSTGFYTLEEKVANRASGYTLHGKDHELTERQPNSLSLPGRPSSAGGAFATAGDLLRFVNALQTNKLTSQKWTNWIFSNSFEAVGRPSLGIAGGAPGLNAEIDMESDWTVIAMSNYDPPSARMAAAAAMEVITGHKREARMRPPSGPDTVRISGPVAVPLTRVRHLLVVEAKVNGKGPFRFTVDSGAAGMIRVSESIAESLALEKMGEAISGDPSGKNSQRVSIVRVRSVEIGGAEFGGVEATVERGPSPEGTDGVIGLGLFDTLTVALDFRKPELRLTTEPLPAGDPHVIAFTTERGIPVIEIDVAGTKMKVDVDTGSPALLSVPTEWSKRMTFAGEPHIVGHARTTANEFDILGADLKGDISVAGYPASNPTVDIVDLFPVANVGSRFWKDYVVTFDLKNKRLGLTK